MSTSKHVWSTCWVSAMNTLPDGWTWWLENTSILQTVSQMSWTIPSEYTSEFGDWTCQLQGFHCQMSWQYQQDHQTVLFYNPTRSKWLDLLTHSTLRALSLTTSSPLLDPTMVCGTTLLLSTASVITGDGSTWTVKWLPGMLVLSWWGPRSVDVYLTVHTPIAWLGGGDSITGLPNSAQVLLTADKTICSLKYLWQNTLQ